jgi:hypothetical protein
MDCPCLVDASKSRKGLPVQVRHSNCNPFDFVTRNFVAYSIIKLSGAPDFRALLGSPLISRRL